MSAWTALALEALRDTVRRRSLLAAGVASAIAALAVNRCSGCHASVVLQGQSVQSDQLAGLTAVLSFGLLAIWTYAMAALLASDGLATALEDGTAESVLARPVSRDVLSLARLGGTLAGALGVGLALLALAAGLLHVRQGLALAPAVASCAAIAIGAWSSAALAMALSLTLPRPATLLAMTMLAAVLCSADASIWLAGSAAPGHGLWTLLGRWGPGWISGPLAPLSPWLGAEVPPPPPLPWLRAVGWALLATGALVLAFRRRELLR